jgi:hypothetical protein
MSNSTTKLISASGGSVPSGEEVFSTGTFSWTAPAGVTTVSITGQGANGSAESAAVFSSSIVFTSGTLTYAEPQCFGTDVGSSYTSDRSSRISTFNGELAAVSGSSWVRRTFTAGYYMYCTTTATYKRYISSSSKYTKKLGSTVYYRISAGSTGASTTALGRTFSGGTPTSTTASTITVNNVSVTPGQTYSVTNNQYLKIFWG